MKKIVLALMLAVPMLVNAQQKEFTAEHFEAVPSYVEFANGRCQIDVKLSIPPKFMRKTTVAELVPAFTTNAWASDLTATAASPSTVKGMVMSSWALKSLPLF